MSVSGTPRNFSYTLTTNADKEVFWNIWTDVENWPAFDIPLKEAKLKGEMRVGAIGSITTKQGQRSGFKITHYNPGKGYSFTTQLPGCKLVVKRYFENRDKLTFTHNVYFEGPLTFLFSRMLGPSFMKALPPIMENLKTLAEEANR